MSKCWYNVKYGGNVEGRKVKRFFILYNLRKYFQNFYEFQKNNIEKVYNIKKKVVVLQKHGVGPLLSNFSFSGRGNALSLIKESML